MSFLIVTALKHSQCAAADRNLTDFTDNDFTVKQSRERKKERKKEKEREGSSKKEKAEQISPLSAETLNCFALCHTQLHVS